MNLVTGDWIPVIYGNQESKRVGLKTLYEEAEEIRDLAVNPPQRIALMRLLICITQAALDGPEDEEGWYNCKSGIIPQSLAYLEKWRDRFDLYGERPFLQVREIEEKLNAKVDKLDFGLAAGNSPVLFDHEAMAGNRIWDDGWRALNLLTYQCFSPGGLIGTNVWNDAATAGTSEHALCIQESAFHTFVRTQDLLGTIHANIITDVMFSQMPVQDWGRPVWEYEHVHSEMTELTHTFLGQLIPYSRLILLNQGAADFTLANGISYPKLPISYNPFSTVIIKKRQNKEELGYMSIVPSIHPWRELGSILLMKKGEQTGGAFPLKHIQYLEESNIDIWVGGMAADKAKLIDYADFCFTIKPELLGDCQLLTYKNGVQQANHARRKLADGIEEYFALLNMPGFGKNKNDLKSRKMREKILQKGINRYWAELDSQHQVLIQVAESGGPPFEQSWHPILKKAAQEAYAYACPHETPRQIQAFAKGQEKLNMLNFNHKKENGS